MTPPFGVFEGPGLFIEEKAAERSRKLRPSCFCQYSICLKSCSFLSHICLVSVLCRIPICPHLNSELNILSAYRRSLHTKCINKHPVFYTLAGFTALMLGLSLQNSEPSVSTLCKRFWAETKFQPPSKKNKKYLNT